MIAFIIIFSFLLYFIEKWSMDNALRGIEFYYEPSKLLVEPSEEFEIITTITNKTRRVAPFIRIEERLPSKIKVHSENLNLEEMPHDLKHISSIYMLPREKLIRKITVSLEKRGRYILQGADLSGGDFLGIRQKKEEFLCFNEVVVYPKEAPLSDIYWKIGDFLGDISVKRFIIEDPILTVGFREYTGREPMKNISWTQSARINRLMVKQFDYTTEPSVTVLLNVECEDADRDELIETCFSLTRTVCRMLEERGIKYDFLTNANTSNAFSEWSYIDEGLGIKHFLTILEGLGRAFYTSIEPFKTTVKKIADTFNMRSLIVITPCKLHEHKNLLESIYGQNTKYVLMISASEIK